MRKLTTSFLFLLIGICGFSFTYVPDALAIPAFARKYDVSCVMCHTAFPKLNDFGNNFRDNGYQMGADSDLPTNQDKGYFPIAFRTTVGYEYASQNHVQGIVTGNSTDNYSSGLGSLGMDILSAGTLDRDISFLVVPTGENSLLGGPATFSLESAWVRFDNLYDSPMLNVKIGYSDLDIPFSEHRSLTPSSKYAIYHYIPGVPYNSNDFPVGDSTSIAVANKDTFAFGNHQGVLQLMGHRVDPVGIFRYSVNLVSNNQMGGHDTGYYLHVTQSMSGGGYSSGYRGGLFYLNMPIPTVSDTQNTAATTPALANVGSAAKPVTKYGLDLSGNFLNSKLNVFGVYMIGQNAKELITGATDDAKFWGGFVEANYMATPKLLLLARYDVIKNTTQPVATITPVVGPAISSDGYNDVNGMTLAARYALVIHNRGEIWAHSELNETTNKKTAFDGSDQKNDALFLGFDFAY
ncbi:MAG: hypothetical protein HY036_10535 [Nitrospirae bacterium]|nr:hypothetical protein [Nitrospirota bacterium]MBI3352998.1 hypothetical protein [Nitrospirota bacterium]